MQYSNVVVLPISKSPTMSSLEMVDYINAERKAKAEAEGVKFPCKKYRRLQHNNFMAKTPKVLGENHSAKFLAQYKDSIGRELPCYRFPKREACLMAMSYSYELQAQVFDHMTELEGGKDINLLDLSGLTELTIKQMQDRVALAEKYSFTEHGQKGSNLMTLRRKEKKSIKKAEQLVRDLIQFKLCDLGDFPEIDEEKKPHEELCRIH
ncbi:Rha family transcriptional regulator [Arsenophonus nasoniae]|uniref:Rha family transcriptional regulator n=1 Tax=Arsenophonus nasoniae TaxID=638 RepID=UPI00387A562D